MSTTKILPERIKRAAEILGIPPKQLADELGQPWPSSTT